MSGVVLTREHWIKNLLEIGHQPRHEAFSEIQQRSRVRDQGEPPNWRLSAVVQPGKGLATPGEETPHDDPSKKPFMSTHALARDRDRWWRMVDNSARRRLNDSFRH